MTSCVLVDRQKWRKWGSEFRRLNSKRGRSPAVGLEMFGDIDGLLNVRNDHTGSIFRQLMVQEPLHLGQELIETFTRLAKLSEVTAV